MFHFKKNIIESKNKVKNAYLQRNSEEKKTQELVEEVYANNLEDYLDRVHLRLMISVSKKKNSWSFSLKI